MIEVSVWNARLSYGKIQTLKDVSLDVEDGSIFGIIDPDETGTMDDVFYMLARNAERIG